MTKLVLKIWSFCLVFLLVVQSEHFASVHAKSKKKQTQENFDAKSKPGQYTCSQCGKSFKTEQQLRQHLKDTKHKMNLNDVKNTDENGRIKMNDNRGSDDESSSQRKLERQKSVERPENAAKLTSTRQRRASIDKIEKDSIAIDKYEKKSASQDYSYYVKKIIDFIRTLEGGKIYSASFYKAGSHGAKTKIGKADEFDVNIPVNIDVKSVRTEGTLTYIYEDKNHLDDKFSSPQEMKSERKLKEESNKPRNIPHGRAVVEVPDPNIIPHLTHKGDLIPHKLLQDLHSKVEKAIQDVEVLANVELSPVSRGPALTITVKQSKDSDIMVDLVLSLPCSKFLSMPSSWPRKNTRKVFDQNKIRAVDKAGLHLVPKGDETWTISYSKAEKELLDGIDKGNECRREVLRLLKYYLHSCKDKVADGLPGLSSHIVTTQILWSNENHRDPGYWSQKTKDVCLLDTIDDIVMSLEKAHLPDYFDEQINILAHKNRSELTAFIGCLNREKEALNPAEASRDEL